MDTEFDREAFYTALKAHKLTLTRLAREMGINRSTLYRKINGRSIWMLKEFQVCTVYFTDEELQKAFVYGAYAPGKGS